MRRSLILSGLLLSALAQMIQPADMTRAEAASGVSVGTGWDHTARLDWADEAWSESYISRYGSPAITINATAGVTLVLSEASLYDANAAGLTLERAVAVFLGRYGPKQCSHIIDLSKPITGLTVKLLIQREKPLPDASSDTRQGVKDALENADVPDQTARHRQKRYDSETVFEVTSEGTIVTFDYMPEKKMQCISPSAPEERESLYGTI